MNLVVVDAQIPLAVEFDLVTGHVLTALQWDLSAHHRGRPVALDVIYRGDWILVASPAAGGVVRIDRRSGESSTIPLDEDPGFLIASATQVWVIAAPDWLERSSSGEVAMGDRPVVWEEGPDIEARAREGGWVAYAPLSQDADDGSGWTLQDWRNEEGDTERLAPPTPIWRLVTDGAERVAFEGEAPTFAAINDLLIGVCELPSDPIIKQVDRDGYGVSWHYPGSVVVGNAGEWQRIGGVHSNSGSLWVDNDRVWMIGFGGDGDGEAPEVRELHPDVPDLGDPLPIPVDHPLAVISGHVVDLQWRSGDRPWALRLSPMDPGGTTRKVELRGLSPWAEPRVDSGSAYVVDQDRHVISQIPIASGDVHDLFFAVDVSEYVPQRVDPPAGLDLGAHENHWLEYLKRGLESEGFGGFVQGIHFDEFRLTGTFPMAAVVGLFHAEEFGEVQFGRRWPLYDELGNPSDLTYSDVHFMEDVEAGPGLLSRVGHYLADQDGIVWI